MKKRVTKKEIIRTLFQTRREFIVLINVLRRQNLITYEDMRDIKNGVIRDKGFSATLPEKPGNWEPTEPEVEEHGKKS